MADDRPKLYDDLAAWWPLLSAPEDYAEEAAFYRRVLEAESARPVRHVLELGSGGGNNASHLKAHWQLTLVDRSPGMLAVSRALNPDCGHVEGDMRTVRLGRRFDAVFLHDAVVYLTTREDLKRTLETASAHCLPGGAVLVAPDHVRETFRPGPDHGGHDGPDGRGVRYLDWTWDPDPGDDTYVMDFAYLLREPDGRVRCEYDRHVCGLFAEADWLTLLGEAGFTPRAVPTTFGRTPGAHVVFVGVKQA